MSSTRRDLLKTGIALGGLTLLDPMMVLAGDDAAERLAATPNLTPGPFYPVIKPLEKDADLTVVAGRGGRAQGQVIHVVGQVRNRNGDPVRNARVELWQANASGRYDHPSDPNTAPLDPNFQGYGEQLTDDNGHFHFKTIKPGAYPTLDKRGLRTPHIHFEIYGKNDRTTTQLFFEGEPLNQQDFVYKAIPRNQQAVIAKVQKSGAGVEPGTWLVMWDCTMMQG
jgi:protocatechuate 3,4-dioxygenase, beta subunit